MRKLSLSLKVVSIILCVIFIGTIVIPGMNVEQIDNLTQSNDLKSIHFCFGFVRDVRTTQNDDEIIGYQFLATCVICSTRISGIPVFHYYHNNEELSINEKYIGKLKCVMVLPDFRETWFVCVWSS